MPPNKEDVHLDVIPTITKDDKIEWSLGTDETKHPYLDGDRLDFTGVRRKFFRLHFTLRDETGQNFKFPTVAKDAIWISSDERCPQRDPGSFPGEFKDPAVSGDRLTFSITNKNKEKKGFAYALRVQRNGTGPFVPYDPVVVSGGGGNDQRFDGATIVAVAVAVGGVAVAVIARSLSRRRSPSRF